MNLLRHASRLTGLIAPLAMLMTVASCGKSGPKPTDADVAAYIAQSEPSYVRVGQVSTSFEAADKLGGKDLPGGSWRVDVHFVLHTLQDLYAPTSESRAQRAAFDRAVASVEQYRLPRIAAVEQLGKDAGLMPEGASAPEPPLVLAQVNPAGQDLPDHVALLAQPDGKGWKFFQLDAQALGDDAIGAPIEEIKRSNPTTIFVNAGSVEARDYNGRVRRFLEVLSKAPKP